MKKVAVAEPRSKCIKTPQKISRKVAYVSNPLPCVFWWLKYRENNSDKQQNLLDALSAAGAIVSTCDTEKFHHLGGSVSPRVTVTPLPWAQICQMLSLWVGDEFGLEFWLE